MGKRRRGRILAFQALYAWDMADDKNEALKGLYNFSWVEKKTTAEDFSRLLIAGTLENIEKVDSIIRKHLVHWDFSRLNRVDRALLRMSVFELLFSTAPPSVIIDEAVGISREYGTDDSYRFVNGVLDGIRKTQCMKKENPS
ncbi:MAG: transcription antitermination factor NusB [Treponema sp.]|jgi:N utilization substance protein B|nr:transcription antitermination factor NusB [Treponema sp.]